MIKIDLHVHSKFSKRPSQWILQKIGCPESFMEPMLLYRIAKQKGMSLVTITDHNCIEGALEIAHLPDTFVSEEITAYFPEDRCKTHILAYNITEKHHQDIQKLRENIYELVAYLQQEHILHAIAHSLYSINGRLSTDHFERMLLLFKNFEINGTRSQKQTDCLKEVLNSLQPQDIDELTQKYGIKPNFPEPWKKNTIGGSDDHSGLNIARTYTILESATCLDSALKAIQNNETEVICTPSTPQTLAINLYSIAYQFFKNKFNLGRYVNKDVMIQFLDQSLSPLQEQTDGFISRIYTNFFANWKHPKFDPNVQITLKNLLRQETYQLIQDNPELLQPPSNIEDYSEIPERKWFQFVNHISNKVMNSFANHLFNHIHKANVFDIFHTIGSAGGLYSTLAPYFVSYSHFTKDRQLLADVSKRFNKNQSTDYDSKDYSSKRQINIAHFTDTFYEVNGVARTLQQIVKAAAKNNKQLTLITCNGEELPENGGVKTFKSVGVYELPEYPEVKVSYPPLLEMLNYCYENDFTHIHSATPGPIGLAALAISYFLNLPIYGTYHTAIPQYAQYLTNDNDIEGITWKYILWYYNQMDVIFVSSQSSKIELVEKGIKEEKIRLFPRGIDTIRFHPEKRNGILKDQFKINSPINLLYVGRVSKEKNMHVLVDTFKSLTRFNDQIHLVVVGDGPYLDEMKVLLKDEPCTFTGYLTGDELAYVYASSDVFVFPSTTDTFGNVILEAQASGIPVIVTDQGGPCENMVHGKTGFIVKGDDPRSLFDGIQTMISNPSEMRQMGITARSFTENRSFEKAFLETWEIYSTSADKLKQKQYHDLPN